MVFICERCWWCLSESVCGVYVREWWCRESAGRVYVRVLVVFICESAGGVYLRAFVGFMGDSGGAERVLVVFI